MTPSPPDPSQLLKDLTALSQFSSSPKPSPAVTRVVFSPEDLAARAFLRDLYEQAGLAVRVDPIGNTFARWAAAETDPTLPPVATGSHCDAIPHAGMYDGTVGVLGALHAVRQLQQQNFKPRRPIDIIMFTSEEPTRFGLGCSGSRALCGLLTPDKLRALTEVEPEPDPNNPDQNLPPKTFDHIRTAAGFTGDLEAVALKPNTYHAFIELHIEQGPVLERENTPIGIVTAIAAPATLDVTLHGQGGHAGATLMPDRKDAFSAAAEIALDLERLAKKTSPDTVATTGLVTVHPNAVNSIPYRVELTHDIRDTDDARRDRMIQTYQQDAQKIAERRGLRVEFHTRNADPAAACDARLTAAAEAACEAANLPYKKLVSRAYHDALFMARLCPIAMIFIPCKDGLSHHPDEYASPAALANGTHTLAQTLAALASE